MVFLCKDQVSFCNPSAGHSISRSSRTNPSHRILEEAIFTAQVLFAPYGDVFLTFSPYGTGKVGGITSWQKKGRSLHFSSMAGWWALDEGDKVVEGSPTKKRLAENRLGRISLVMLPKNCSSQEWLDSEPPARFNLLSDCNPGSC